MCVSTRRESQFQSVLLHPPSLAPEFIAIYGEMSRRSGVAAEEDNHPDISPFGINDLRAVGIRLTQKPPSTPNKVPARFSLNRLRSPRGTGGKEIVSDLITSSDHLRRLPLQSKRVDQRG